MVVSVGCVRLSGADSVGCVRLSGADSVGCVRVLTKGL